MDYHLIHSREENNLSVPPRNGVVFVKLPWGDMTFLSPPTIKTGGGLNFVEHQQHAHLYCHKI